MGLFPEDHKIAVDDLLKLWMAEEFVLNVETENMEEASRNFLNDLLNRSLVLVSQKKINGDIEMCLLHDVVREFCLIKLKEEKFMQLTVPYSPYQHLCSMNSRLCVYIHDDLVKQLDHYEYQFDKIPLLESKESTKCFGECSRSLEFIAHPNFNSWNASNPLPLLVKLRLVRVCIFLMRICQVLGLSRTSPAAIWKMKKLRHLNVNKLCLVWDDNDKAIFEETSTTRLENLKTFHSHLICVDDMNPRFWWRFANLEELSLRVEALPSCPLFPSVEVHTRLQSLNLVISPRGFLDSGGFPLRITKHNCWDVTNVEFPALKYLALHFVRMEELKASEESFPVLEVLSIRNGYFYKEIPPSFTDIPTLRLIKLYDYTNCLGVSAMNIKKEIEENTGCDSLQVLLLS
ncbi:hypothetical protein MTR67_028247 [Solanum verrucosum]|uniref:Disease resistance protein winged helix domain-containing protein n=1 Tax=Solanum verrucosum TaxID=315347 RepID=A0AAF0R6S7_SOLVR|nr:hypothetical protein MTR67_028247 [Solanum verrucosum]